MIRNQEEFEAALEELIALLDGPHDPAVEDRVAWLAQAIEEYRVHPEMPAPPPAMLAEKREQLRKHLESFETRWPPRSSLMTDVDAVLAPLIGRAAQATAPD